MPPAEWASVSAITASTKPAKSRALVLAMRPVGKTAHRSMAGRLQGRSSCRTAPLAISGANIQSDAMVRPMSVRTAARRPSAALTRTRPRTATETSVPSRVKAQISGCWL